MFSGQSHPFLYLLIYAPSLSCLAPRITVTVSRRYREANRARMSQDRLSQAHSLAEMSRLHATYRPRALPCLFLHNSHWFLS
ncbi:hypothetical protein DFH07DRAFT_30047 [Mycena maculata]|uniref:Uncharacterized protein n=1 Tax=Mycena maculata TaxID=230809 RepID=A0AAD7NVE8_9AGAR|nr:hypothetical protein DFH07DRAFT_30047 [Mycena maculata]